MSEQDIAAFARSYWDAEARRDTDAVLEHYAAHAVLHHAGGTVTGHDELRAYYDAGAEAFPGLEVDIVRTLALGDEAALEWTAVLIDHDGARFPVRGANVVTMEDGLFGSVRTYFQAPTA